MAQIGSPVSAEELDEIMTLCDKDGDGSCDYTEFAQVSGAKVLTLMLCFIPGTFLTVLLHRCVDG